MGMKQRSEVKTAAIQTTNSRGESRKSTMASALSASVSSLRASLQLLESSIDILDEGVNDFPRLCKVLQSTRVSCSSVPINGWIILVANYVLLSTSNCFRNPP